MLGTAELLAIGFLALLFFGKDKLPELGKGLGGFMKEIKSGMSDTGSKTTKH